MFKGLKIYIQLKMFASAGVISFHVLNDVNMKIIKSNELIHLFLMYYMVPL